MPPDPTRICHVVASVNSATGGPAFSVTGLARAQGGSGAAVSICALEYPELGAPPDCAPARLLAISPNPATRPLRGWSPTLARAIRTQAPRSALIHNHGLWMWPNLYARQAAAAARRPLIISPRGMLEPWSLSQARLKKRFAWLAFERRNLAGAAAFHATSTGEAQAIRALGLQQPIAVIPNGVDLPEDAPILPRGVLEERWPSLAGQQWLLFLSRLDPKKGVDLLLEVWSSLASQFKGWRLLVAGGARRGERARYETLALERGVASSVVFTGHLHGAARECALQHASVFVLPTRSENFGMAIAEALAYGLPVVTTRMAPWPLIAQEQCGWWIEPDTVSLRQALREALLASPDARRAMGERGRRLVATRFTWAAAAGAMAQFYRWCCDGGPRPPCVALWRTGGACALPNPRPSDGRGCPKGG